jgi:hypothetical protein
MSTDSPQPTRRPGISLTSLPCDSHSLIYSYLNNLERFYFFNISKVINSDRKNYQEMKLNPASSLRYVRDEIFRDRVSSLVMPGHLDLNLLNETPTQQLTDIEINHMGNVGALSLLGSQEITDEGLWSLGHLQCLRWFDCSVITDLGFSYLGNLKELMLSNCDQITDEGFHYLWKLQSLSLDSCHGVTDRGLAYL